MKHFIRTDLYREDEDIANQRSSCGTSTTGFLDIFGRLLQRFLKRKIFAFNRTKPVYKKLEEDIFIDEFFDSVEDAASFESYDEEEDAIFCVVCERTFDTRRMLNYHRLKKRHYYCTTCEDIFSSFMQLQRHSHNCDHNSDEEKIYCPWENHLEFQQLDNEAESLL